MTVDKKYTPEARARASALGSLAMREHSCEELRAKLINKKHDPDLVDHLILDLLNENLISDFRFAESYWRSRSNKGYGPTRIARELAQKGVAVKTIKQAKSEAKINFYDLIVQVYEKKYKGVDFQDYREKARRQGFLYRRGFDTDYIKTVIE